MSYAPMRSSSPCRTCFCTRRCRARGSHYYCTESTIPVLGRLYLCQVDCTFVKSIVLVLGRSTQATSTNWRGGPLLPLSQAKASSRQIAAPLAVVAVAETYPPDNVFMVLATIATAPRRKPPSPPTRVLILSNDASPSRPLEFRPNGEETTCDHERTPAAGAGTRFSEAFPPAAGGINDETTAGTEGCVGEATRRGGERQRGPMVPHPPREEGRGRWSSQRLPLFNLL
ncbi:hypothetical protein GW17_00046094 [Ensete ventricosum]|nr:hypothetical protein GW17_00046094 [Ensete ventricosum]